MPAECQEFLRHFSVSYETRGKFERYAELLGEWNEKFNLVAASTIPHIWQRHFLDSAQLLKFIPTDAKMIADLGSGAGFPGLVLSIMGAPHVRLIESIGKKANFLRTVIDELTLDAEVMQARIEETDLKADVITARALKPLPELLKLSKPLMKKDSLCLFLKGQQLDVELTEAAKYWKFDSETIPSLSDSSGSILIVRNLEFRAKGSVHGRSGKRRRRK